MALDYNIKSMEKYLRSRDPPPPTHPFSFFRLFWMVWMNIAYACRMSKTGESKS